MKITKNNACCLPPTSARIVHATLSIEVVTKFEEKKVISPGGVGIAN